MNPGYYTIITPASSTFYSPRETKQKKILKMWTKFCFTYKIEIIYFYLISLTQYQFFRLLTQNSKMVVVIRWAQREK